VTVFERDADERGLIVEQGAMVRTDGVEAVIAPARVTVEEIVVGQHLQTSGVWVDDGQGRPRESISDECNPVPTPCEANIGAIVVREFLNITSFCINGRERAGGTEEGDGAAVGCPRKPLLVATTVAHRHDALAGQPLFATLCVEPEVSLVLTVLCVGDATVCG
jgi:hypothetical protein